MGGGGDCGREVAIVVARATVAFFSVFSVYGVERVATVATKMGTEEDRENTVGGFFVDI